MTQARRVAVIEIGSRAVRLLIADIYAEGRLENVCTNWQQTGLREALHAGGTTMEESIEKLTMTLRRFRTVASDYNAEQLACFGTDAIRRIAPDKLEQLRSVCPELAILSRKEEAELSFEAAVMRSTETTTHTGALVIDQGSGSMEVVSGSIKSSTVNILCYRSYNLGTTKLVEMLNKSGGFLQLREALRTQVSHYQPFETGDISGRAIVLGSAATSLAWLTSRPDPFAQYDPRQVQGRIIPLKHIESLVSVAESHPDSIQLLIDPHHPGSSEFKTVVSGLIAIQVFLDRQKIPKFEVCGDGTRYGVAWKLARAQYKFHAKAAKATL